LGFGRDRAGGEIVGTCEHIGKVSFGIDFGLSAVFDQSEHDGRSGPDIGVADEQPIFGADFEWAQSILSQIIVNVASGQHILGPGVVDGRLARLTDIDISGDRAHAVLGRGTAEHLDGLDKPHAHEFSRDRADQLL